MEIREIVIKISGDGALAFEHSDNLFLWELVGALQTTLNRVQQIQRDVNVSADEAMRNDLVGELVAIREGGTL